MASIVVPKPTEKPIMIFQGGSLEAPKYIPTYYEWLRSQGQQILLRASNMNVASTTVCAIAAGYSFYVTNLTLSYDLDLPAIGNSPALITKGSNFSTSMTDCLASLDIRATNGYENIAQSFQIPIKIEQGERIFLWQGGGTATSVARCSIQGFLVKNQV